MIYKKFLVYNLLCKVKDNKKNIMKLGTLKLENNFILAPMQNVTTGPYRRFCRNFSKIGLVCVPMIYTKGIMSSPKSFEYELYKIENGKRAERICFS